MEGDTRAPSDRSLRGRGLARGVVVGAAVLHLVALGGFLLALRFVGEASWPTTLLLYLPRWPLAAPLPFVALALWVVGPRRLLATQLVAAALLLGPLAGFTWSWPDPPAPAPTVRLLSYNAAFGHGERDAVCREVEANQPQLVVLQAYGPALAPSLERCLAGYERHVSGEFLLASRFPILAFSEPARLPQARAGFVAYTLDTPLGPVELFNVHPISPREAFEGFERASGSPGPPSLRERILSADAHALVRANTVLRRDQVRALAAATRSARHPVVVAGDTNLPGLSRLFAEELGGLQDGFARAGRGFGYTFPAGRPWMRIDRVLAGPELRFTRFRVGDRSRTSHACVVAELQRRGPGGGR